MEWRGKGIEWLGQCGIKAAWRDDCPECVVSMGQG